ncbi:MULTISPECIES: DUF481 domain-containing protein [Aliiglaciecola]|uniref:DUF481 domain-containing protein n=1 Tax=Aliiglaciecola TaxID=1406885 RepID=UPI001C08C71A|nr:MULTISPECIES: DUF481 domain-containing protein [Aliiglaciecola]MBU2876909.1 DUF481 domain-containing protein [Aliiglaciecola lipolytica]MDO6712599.1 DUF481 domain-containing protein [Aliiglaciecola sp. 2_MG-2023]MDO6753793.1 DUF481 domain-containing protein [Aliiglaciecola sp. 1_MG-2023]
MKLICATICLFISFSSSARTDVIRALFLADAPFHGDATAEHHDSFTMNGEFGVIYADGNTTGTTVTGKLNAKQDLLKWHHRYVAKVLYKQNEQVIDENSELVTSAQNVFVSMQSDFKLKNPTNRLFMYGEYEDDRFNSYRYQAALAVGYTEQLWSDKESEFTYSVGPGYARSIAKENTDVLDQTGVIIRAAMEYEKKFNDMATFRQYLSTETDDEFSRSFSETSLAAKINGSLAMKLSFNMTHNRSPQELDEPLDTQTSVTLVYQFF